MKILFVSNPVVIHTARWIEQISDLGWEIDLFSPRPTSDLTINAEMPTSVRIHLVVKQARSRIRQTGLAYPFEKGDRFRLAVTNLYERFRPRAERLASLIRKLRPDVVHSMEMQGATYLTLEAKRIVDESGGVFPPWIYSSWGSDMYHFGGDLEHSAKIRNVLSNVDYFIADCQRDVHLAKQYGFNGETLGVYPTGGGFPIEKMREFATEPITDRRIIAVKGLVRSENVGRAMVAMDAIERSENWLRNYEIVVYLADELVADRALEIKATTGLNIKIFPPSSHSEFLQLLGKTKISLGINVSDGSPNAMLESMLMGAFPIQSDTGSTREWVRDGVNGRLVDPNDENSIAQAIKDSIDATELLENAARYNYEALSNRLHRSRIRTAVVRLYEKAGLRGKSKDQPIIGLG